MTQPVKTTDTHVIKQVTTGGPGSLPVHGSNVWSIFNSATGEEVDRVEGFSNAQAAQAKWNAKAKASGQ